MQDSPETDITCKKNNIDRRPFIYKARLIYKSCKRGYIETYIKIKPSSTLQ